MAENEIFLVDSNVLIYYYDSADTRKHDITKSLIDKCWKNERKLAISTQTLSEFFSVVTKKEFLSRADAIRVITDIIEFDGWIKINFNHITVLAATVISDQYNMPYWDSLLAATMRQNGVLKIYTENSKDFKTPWLIVKNPFD